MFSSSLQRSGLVARAAPSTGRAFVPVVAKATDHTRKSRTAKRHFSIRKKISGTTERPRLAVYRSNQHIYAQVIDDTRSVTLASASTLTPEVKSAVEGNGATVSAAQAVGKKVAELAKAAGVEKVAFDRGGFTYHGRIQALADAAREAGLSF
ncbi:50S ribosomal protein L18 [Raphidocelis subcapitata]|uniref:Large ribosomal subunit protein uL18c n=1 Tax=Raphidocelis subcapitata TaxID=307507 RepID=A0A2V0PB77_9CHLO|nr:50S ribosomal protein L18 [Raphidocelis subcapitata]|eukprot:GBF96192.1 50S ribosomal protein L18 [Raphidocelis subcapitata]